MNRRKTVIIAASILYGLFFFWYTNFGGPISKQEIAAAVDGLRENGLTDERIEVWKGFMETDTGNQFIMLNNLDMNPAPPKMPKTPDDATAQDLMDVYMEHMYPELLKRASHPIFFGQAVHQALDVEGIENASSWSHGALFRYRSRADLIEIALNPQSKDRHEYKIAALTKTIAYPVKPTLYLSDPRLLLFLILTSLVSIVLIIRK